MYQTKFWMNAHAERLIQSSVINNHPQLGNITFNEISIKWKQRHHLNTCFLKVVVNFSSVCGSSKLKNFIPSLTVNLVNTTFLICYIWETNVLSDMKRIWTKSAQLNVAIFIQCAARIVNTCNTWLLSHGHWPLFPQVVNWKKENGNS